MSKPAGDECFILTIQGPLVFLSPAASLDVRSLCGLGLIVITYSQIALGHS